MKRMAHDAHSTTPPRPLGPSLWVWAIAIILFGSMGTWALRLQAQQARDTTRKHDIEDLEHALLRYGRLYGTYPPIDAPTWCGRFSDPDAAKIQHAVLDALRKDEKYAKPEKPFPQDPRFGGSHRDYFYWKRSPTSFELLAELEADANDTKDTRPCGGSTLYDYGILSIERTPF